MPRFSHHLKNAFVPHQGNDYRPHALRLHWLNIYAVMAVTVKVAVVILVGFYASEARVSDTTPSAIISLTNQARIERKIVAVKLNPLLMKAAESKAADMSAKHYFAHTSPSGVTPWTWFKKAGYNYTYAGENLALDYVSSEEVIEAWLLSPSHRANLLSAKFKDIGVAVATANINGIDSVVVVQMFGAPQPTVTTKKVTTPAQTPTPAKAKQTVVATPPPKVPPPVPSKVPQLVLGEERQEIPPTPPGIPTMVTPGPNSIVRTAQVEVVGQAEPGSTVTLYANGTRIATAVAATSGLYSATPSENLAEGVVKLQVNATARGVTSNLSSERTVTVDTISPALDAHQTVLLSSYIVDDAFDVSMAVTGQPTSVILAAGGESVTLKPHGQEFTGRIQLSSAATLGSALTVTATDEAGNQLHTALADPNFFTTGVVVSTTGPFVRALKLLFFSHTFLLVFMCLFFIIAAFNISYEWRHQHNPTIIGSFLILFLIGTLLVM